MGLVDDDQRDACLPQRPQESVLPKALRRGVDELVGTCGDLIRGALLLGGGEGAVDEDGPLAQSGRQAFDLVLHQGDQRREHQRRARQEQRRKLEGQRLARAGGQDRQRVVASKYPVDDGGLAGEKTFVAEHHVQCFQDPAISDDLFRGQRCEVAKLKHRFSVRSMAVWRRWGGAGFVVWRTAVRPPRFAATKGGINLRGERGGALRFQPGISQPKCLRSRGLPNNSASPAADASWGAVRHLRIGERARASITASSRSPPSKAIRRHRQHWRNASRIVQLRRPVIVRYGHISPLESDLGIQGLNRGQLTVLCEERVSHLGRFIQVPQLQEGAGEADAGARRGIAGKAALPAGADTVGVTRRKCKGSTLIQKRGRLACLSLDQVQQRRGVVELTGDPEPCRKLESESGWQGTRVVEGDLWFVKGHRGIVPGVGGRLAGALHACSPGRAGR